MLTCFSTLRYARPRGPAWHGFCGYSPPVERSFLLVTALLAPAAGRALEFEEARHLLARTGFSPTLEEIQAILPLSHDVAVERLLARVRTDPVTPPPDWTDDPPPDPAEIKGMSEEERQKFRERERKNGMELKGWWCREMAETDSPLTERLTLFWHNHFTSSLEKVKHPVLLWRQNALLRRNACGDFRTLLHAIARDPAMVIYLDSQSNRKGKPNENFARELLELFTLGESHYTEADIQSAARAFTGWSVDRESGEFRIVKRQHDDGEKTFMGHAGNHDGDAVIDILLEHPRVAVHLTEKLWREFVSGTPDPKEIERLAGIFRKSDYALKPLLSALFASPAFRAPESRGTMTKSPAELLVGTVRLLGMPVADGRLIAQGAKGLGQDLIDPPNVKGWPGGTAWITASTLLMRRQILERVVRGQEMEDGGMDAGDRKEKKGRAPRWRTEDLLAGLAPDDPRLRQLVLAIPPVNPEPEGTDPRALVTHWLLDPAYQLK